MNAGEKNPRYSGGGEVKTALDEWVEFTRAWVDEQMAEIAEKDEAAYARFRERLLLMKDE